MIDCPCCLDSVDDFCDTCCLSPTPMAVSKPTRSTCESGSPVTSSNFVNLNDITDIDRRITANYRRLLAAELYALNVARDRNSKAHANYRRLDLAFDALIHQRERLIQKHAVRATSTTHDFLSDLERLVKPNRDDTRTLFKNDIPTNQTTL